MSDPTILPASEQPSFPVRKPRIVTVFFRDPDAPRLAGVRPGWRLLIFVLALLGFGRGFEIIANRIRLHLGVVAKFSDPWFVIWTEGAGLVALLLATRLMGWLEVRSLAAYGLPPRGFFGSRFWQGLVWGLLALTLVLLAMSVAGGISFGSIQTQGWLLIRSACEWGLAMLLVGVSEEFAFRGYALQTLGESLGFWPAALLFSFFFGALHLGNPGEDWAGALSAGLIGLFFCFTLWRFGSLWFAIGMHAGWDFAESFLFGVPNSGLRSRGALLSPAFHGPTWLTGGNVGPEGSVFCFLVIALAAAAFEWRYPARKLRASSDLTS